VWAVGLCWHNVSLDDGLSKPRKNIANLTTIRLTIGQESCSNVVGCDYNRVVSFYGGYKHN